MKRLLYLLAASSALISSTPASAQDQVPSQPSVHSWSGFYGGVFGGYNFGDADVESDNLVIGDGETTTTVTTTTTTTATTTTTTNTNTITGSDTLLQAVLLPAFSGDDVDFSLEDESWLAGAQIGFDRQSGNWVFGIVGDVTWLDFEGTEPLYFFPGDPPVGEFGVELDWLATVRGRIGYAVDRFLFYGTAGIAFGDVEAALGTTPFIGPFASVADVDPDDWTYYDADQNLHVGYAVGVGAAAKLTPNIELEATYLYVDLGEETYDFSDDGTDLGSADIDLDFNIFRFGLNYRFSTR